MEAGANIDCKIMVFEPTMEEFCNFPEYIKYMESKGAHKGGVAKIIPPKEWKACKQYNMRRIGELVIDSPVSQTVTGQQGLFQLFNVQKKPLKVKEYKELAESTRYKAPEDKSIENMERQYWKNIIFNQPIYGADVPGSITDKDVKHWNIAHLGTILDLLESDIKVKLLGVNTPYLYFGMWKTTFPWHTEDMDLYSINYLHFGAPKSWYSIPPEHGKRLETLAKGFFSGSFADCSEFLRHKMTIISPHVLKKFSIPVNKMTHYAGEFMITFPYGYHSGYNHGFNCAESTNFASERWIEYGRKAKHCLCKSDSVKINMDVFIRKFLPDDWKVLQQERRKDQQIDAHNNRKTARANYSSESSRGKIKTMKKMMVMNGGDDDESDDENNSSSGSDESSDDDSEQEEEIPDKDSPNQSAAHSDSSSSSEEENDWDLKKQPPVENKDIPIVRTKTKLTLYKKDTDTNCWQAADKCSNVSRRHTIHKKLKRSGKCSKEDVKEEIKDKCTNGNPYQSSILIDHMWNHRPSNSEEETTFNKLLSLTEARCSICVYFSKKDAEYLHQIDSSKLKSSESCTPKGNACGKLLVTELCFAMDTSEENSIETAFNLMFGNGGSVEELSLLTCAQCHVAVHNSCYGVSEHNEATNWYCDKCKALRATISDNKLQISDNKDINNKHNDISRDITCCLCSIRGGALKRTTIGRWCHVVCAISIPEVSFHNKKDRGPIDTTTVSAERKKLNCLYCSHLNKSSTVERGACIQCKCGKCAMAFHVTCSFHHGIPLYLGDWPIFVETLCPKHVKRKVVKNEKRSLAEVAVDDLVLAKHKNGRYYRGKVLDTQMMLYYKVVFDDKSFCFDLPPDDIQGVDAKSNIIPNGQTVEILWPDSMTYRAEVTGHWYESLCQVRFEDASILQVKRSDLYLDGEEIPKRVQSKLSYASEVANKFYLPDSLRNGTKRPRMGSWKYKNADTKL